LESGAPVSSATNFRLASVTKQFTAVAVLKLVEADKLTLASTLSDLFESFPSYGQKVQVRHLLSHTSGLLDYEDLMSDSTSIPIRDRGVLSLMRSQDSTYFEPGTAYRYSNSAYAVLAIIVEELSGKSFAGFLKDELFQVAGMLHTVAFEDGISVVPDRAFGHSFEDGRWVRTDQSMTSSVLGDGGIYSSLDDLERWYRSLDAGEVLSPELGRQATTKQPGTEHGDGAGYGFGWFIDARGGHISNRHSGSTIGFRNDVERFPDLGLTVVVLTNRNGPDAEDLAKAVADVYIGSTSL
jgi:CubicO group peptidase (beta-lactamase class C family)